MSQYSARAAWVLTLALLIVFVLVAGKAVTNVWCGALIDNFFRMSQSRLQLAIWTILIVSAYLIAGLTNLARGEPNPLAIALPQQLWILLGISTTSLLGSPLLKSPKRHRIPDDKQREATFRALGADGTEVRCDGMILVNAKREHAKWTDLFRGEEAGNGATLDLGKIQMFFFTVVIVIVYAAALWDLFGETRKAIRAFPDVHESIIVLLGISHTGYLANKALPHTKEKQP